MYVKLIAAYVVTLVISVSYGSDDPPSIRIKFPKYNPEYFAYSVEKTSRKILKAIHDEKNGQNIITSPLGVLLPLSHYAGGLNDNSSLKSQIVSSLEYDDYNQLEHDYKVTSQLFHARDATFPSLYSMIHISLDHELNDEFWWLYHKRNYDDIVTLMNFNSTQAAARRINIWTEQKTRGHIKDAVSADVLTPGVNVHLNNIISFKGHWNVSVDPNLTKEKDFFVRKGQTIKKPTMCITKSFYHKSDVLGAKVIDLPYKEKSFRMFVVVPDEVDGLPSVIDKVAKNGLPITASREEYVKLYMPKFEESDVNSEGVLSKIGLTNLLTEEAPNVIEGHSAFVSTATQKAFLKVDEEGTTAEAFSGLIARNEKAPLTFHVDRPFLVVIIFDKTVLFVGTVNQ